MKEIRVQDDIDAHARLIGRALNYLNYIKDIREEAAEKGIVLTDAGWHEVPRDVFDAAGGEGCELTEWRGFRADGKTYWSKRIRGFVLYTDEPPSSGSRKPDEVRIAGAAVATAKPLLVVSDLCEDCGETRWRLSGDQAGGSPLVKTCERCGKERPL